MTLARLRMAAIMEHLRCGPERGRGLRLQGDCSTGCAACGATPGEFPQLSHKPRMGVVSRSVGMLGLGCVLVGLLPLWAPLETDLDPRLCRHSGGAPRGTRAVAEPGQDAGVHQKLSIPEKIFGFSSSKRSQASRFTWVHIGRSFQNKGNIFEIFIW